MLIGGEKRSRLVGEDFSLAVESSHLHHTLTLEPGANIVGEGRAVNLPNRTGFHPVLALDSHHNQIGCLGWMEGETQHTLCEH